MRKRILFHLVVLYFILGISLWIFENIEMLKGEEPFYSNRNYFIFQNEVIVISLLLFVFIHKKIYNSKYRTKILFAILSFIMVGLASTNILEGKYSFYDIKSVCSYYDFCREKMVYYQNEELLIFVSDDYRIDIIERKNSKYRLVHQDILYNNKQEEDNNEKYIYDLGNDRSFILIKSTSEVDNMDKLLLYDSPWEIEHLYGAVINSN